MKIRSVICIAWSTALSLQLMGQKINKLIQTGNDFYKQQKYDQAVLQYNNALAQEPSNTMAKFNLANTLYRLAKQDEAEKTFDVLSTDSKEMELRSKAYYNKGVMLSLQKRLEESIEAYKNALRQNPDDKDARENLQKALLELKKRNPSPKEKKKQEQQQKNQQPQPKMSQKEAEQRLKQLEQKEKEVQQRLQKQKSKAGGGQAKDW
jgi:Ca-activated chloride channel family protein